MYRFYLTKHQGRRILWYPSLGTANIKGNFNGKKREFIMSTYQMCIIMLFNKSIKYSFNEIKNATQINEGDLKINIDSLVDFDLLSIEINTEKYVLNQNFIHRNYKLKIPIKKKNKEIEEMKPKNIEGMQLERKYTIEATLIRVMKSRKKIEHTQLINEVLKISTRNTFIPSQNLIKNCIESLIEREFIERLGEKNWYGYMS